MEHIEIGLCGRKFKLMHHRIPARIDENDFFCYKIGMKNVVLASSVFLASFSMGGVVYACDMHGGGFSGYGMRNAPWQSYNPQVSTTDPALAQDDLKTSIPAVPPKKAKPSFSNAANNAATKAKARLAKKAISDKTDKPTIVKKPS